MSCPYAKGRATACIQAYCCVRTKNTRQPVKNRRSPFGGTIVFRRDESRLRPRRKRVCRLMQRAQKQPHSKGANCAYPPCVAQTKGGRHSRHENKKRAKNRDTYAVFAHKKNRPPKAVCFFALVTCSAPDGRLLPSLPQAACGVLPTFLV